jgi:hypothetical protein
MRKYTQRELIQEGPFWKAAAGMAASPAGRVAGRAALGLARFISPTLGGLIDKGLAKLSDLKGTYLTPERAVDGALKALQETNQIKAYGTKKELTPAQYQQKKNDSTQGRPTRRTLDVGFRSTSNKYYECELEIVNDNGSSTKGNFAFTISSTSDIKNPKIFIWKAVTVEDITPKTTAPTSSASAPSPSISSSMSGANY